MWGSTVILRPEKNTFKTFRAHVVVHARGQEGSRCSHGEKRKQPLHRLRQQALGISQTWHNYHVILMHTLAVPRVRAT